MDVGDKQAEYDKNNQLNLCIEVTSVLHLLLEH